MTTGGKKKKKQSRQERGAVRVDRPANIIPIQPMGGVMEYEVEAKVRPNLLVDKFVEQHGRPKVIIAPRMHALFMQMHKNIPNCEWSGIARAEKRDGHYYLSDIIFPEQENSTCLTTITEDGKEAVMDTLLDRFDNHGESMKEWNVWFHSHHSMGCFWSHTDLEQFENNNEGNTHFFINIVTSYQNNKATGQQTWEADMYKATMSIYKPFRLDVDMIVELGIDENPENDDKVEELYERWRAAVADATKEVEEENKEIIEKRDAAIAQLEAKYGADKEPTEEEMKQVLKAMNIEGVDESDDEMAKLIRELIIEDYQLKLTNGKTAINDLFKPKAVSVDEINIQYTKELESLEENLYNEYVENKVAEQRRNEKSGEAKLYNKRQEKGNLFDYRFPGGNKNKNKNRGNSLIMNGDNEREDLDPEDDDDNQRDPDIYLEGSEHANRQIITPNAYTYSKTPGSYNTSIPLYTPADKIEMDEGYRVFKKLGQKLWKGWWEQQGFCNMCNKAKPGYYASSDMLPTVCENCFEATYNRDLLPSNDIILP